MAISASGCVKTKSSRKQDENSILKYSKLSKLPDLSRESKDKEQDEVILMHLYLDHIQIYNVLSYGHRWYN